VESCAFGTTFRLDLRGASRCRPAFACSDTLKYAQTPFHIMKRKYVQTELDMMSYSKLRNLSEMMNITIKEAIRQAIMEYISIREGGLEDDSIFSMIGALDLGRNDWSERKDWSDWERTRTRRST